MMRSSGVFLVVCLLLLCLPALAAVDDVNTITIHQSTGSNANYDSATKTLTWSGGSNAFLSTMGGAFAFFDSVNWSFQANMISDSSSGGTASATFDLVGSWGLDLYDSTYGASPVIELSGTLNSGAFGGKYLENETAGGDAVDGKAWINVIIDAYNSSWVSALGLTDINAGDEIFGMQANAILDVASAGFADYDTDDYDSTNGLTVTFFSDQSQVIPEPMTIALFTLGGLLLRSRSPKLKSH